MAQINSELSLLQMQQNLHFAQEQRIAENNAKQKFTSYALNSADDPRVENISMSIGQQHAYISIGQGGRNYQQDRFDVQLAPELGSLTEEEIAKVLHDTVIEFGEKYENTAGFGATGHIEIFTGNALIVANLGDSRGVLLGAEAKQTSYDHKPGFPAEKARIQLAGGNVNAGKFVAANSRYQQQDKRGIAIARSFGNDCIYTGKSHIPSMNIIPLTKDLQQGIKHWLVIASDGLWDALSSDDLLTLKQQHDNLASFANAARKLAYQRMCAETELYRQRLSPDKRKSVANGNELADNCVVMASELVEDCIYAVFDGHGTKNDIVDELRAGFIPRFREKVEELKAQKKGQTNPDDHKQSSQEIALPSQEISSADTEIFDALLEEVETEIAQTTPTGAASHMQQFGMLGNGHTNQPPPSKPTATSGPTRIGKQ